MSKHSKWVMHSIVAPGDDWAMMRIKRRITAGVVSIAADGEPVALVPEHTDDVKWFYEVMNHLDAFNGKMIVRSHLIHDTDADADDADGAVHNEIEACSTSPELIALVGSTWNFYHVQNRDDMPRCTCQRKLLVDALASAHG